MLARAPEVLRCVAHRLASAAHGRRPLRQLTHARPTVLRRPHRARPDRLRLARRPPRRGAARPRAARPARRRSRDAAGGRHVAVAEDRPAGLLRVPRFRAARAARMVRRASRRARLARAQAYSEETTTWRRALLHDEPPGRAAAQAEARAALRAGASANRAWWCFEGRSVLDCALLTDRLIVTVEGQRTEPISAATYWYPNRSQLVRNLEAAEQIAHERAWASLLSPTSQLNRAPTLASMPCSATAPRTSTPSSGAASPPPTSATSRGPGRAGPSAWTRRRCRRPPPTCSPSPPSGRARRPGSTLTGGPPCQGFSSSASLPRRERAGLSLKPPQRISRSLRDDHSAPQMWRVAHSARRPAASAAPAATSCRPRALRSSPSSPRAAQPRPSSTTGSCASACCASTSATDCSQSPRPRKGFRRRPRARRAHRRDHPHRPVATHRGSPDHLRGPSTPRRTPRARPVAPAGRG